MKRLRSRSLAVILTTAVLVGSGAFLKPGELRAQSAAVTCGYNSNGQLGNGSTTTSTTPVAVYALSNGVAVMAAGGYHSLAIRNGALYVWGHNANGQLGNGTTTDSLTPILVGSLSGGVTATSAGGYHSMAVQNGALYVWGDNNYGQLGNGGTTSSMTPGLVDGLTSGVTAVAGGCLNSLAIQNGGLYAWGYLPPGVSTSTSQIPIAVTGFSSGVTALAAGEYHNLFVKDGSAYAWGWNNDGKLGNGTTTDSRTPVLVNLPAGVTSIAAGSSHSLAVVKGFVYAWGDNGLGQLGNGGTANSNANPTSGLVDPTDLHDIVCVAAAGSSSYALAPDGSLWVWGYNGNGQLGVGTTIGDYNKPQHLLPPAGFRYTAVEGGAISHHVTATLSPAPAKILSVARTADGHFIIHASGAPNIACTVSASPDLSSGSFTVIGTATADATGALIYDDPDAAGLTKRFYRLTYP